MAKKIPKLLTEERRRRVMETLRRDGRVTVDALAAQFSTSAVTIRNDLDALAKQGLLVRSHGGAVPMADPVRDYPLTQKTTMNVEEKQRIAKAAAALVKPFQTVILDSGSTSLLLAMELLRSSLQGLTVVTHCLPVAMAFVDSPQISVILIGGLFRQISQSNVGPQAERMLQDLHADHLFLAADGIDAQSGFSTPDILEAQLNSVMISVAQEVTVIADATKFGRRGLSRIGNISQAARIITDRRLPEAAAALLRTSGAMVILA